MSINENIKIALKEVDKLADTGNRTSLAKENINEEVDPASILVNYHVPAAFELYVEQRGPVCAAAAVASCWNILWYRHFSKTSDSFPSLLQIRQLKDQQILVDCERLARKRKAKEAAKLKENLPGENDSKDVSGSLIETCDDTKQEPLHDVITSGNISSCGFELKSFQDVLNMYIGFFHEKVELLCDKMSRELGYIKVNMELITQIVPHEDQIEMGKIKSTKACISKLRSYLTEVLSPQLNHPEPENGLILIETNNSSNDKTENMAIKADITSINIDEDKDESRESNPDCQVDGCIWTNPFHRKLKQILEEESQSLQLRAAWYPFWVLLKQLLGKVACIAKLQKPSTGPIGNWGILRACNVMGSAWTNPPPHLSTVDNNLALDFSSHVFMKRIPKSKESKAGPQAPDVIESDPDIPSLVGSDENQEASNGKESEKENKQNETEKEHPLQDFDQEKRLLYVSANDDVETVDAHWQYLVSQLRNPNKLVVYHLKNHYALIYQYRERTIPKCASPDESTTHEQNADGETKKHIVREILTSRRGQRPKHWISFDQVRSQILKGRIYCMMVVTSRERKNSENLENSNDKQGTADAPSKSKKNVLKKKKKLSNFQQFLRNKRKQKRDSVETGIAAENPISENKDQNSQAMLEVFEFVSLVAGGCQWKAQSTLVAVCLKLFKVGILNIKALYKVLNDQMSDHSMPYINALLMERNFKRFHLKSVFHMKKVMNELLLAEFITQASRTEENQIFFPKISALCNKLHEIGVTNLFQLFSALSSPDQLEQMLRELQLEREPQIILEAFRCHRETIESNSNGIMSLFSDSSDTPSLQIFQDLPALAESGCDSLVKVVQGNCSVILTVPHGGFTSDGYKQQIDSWQRQNFEDRREALEGSHLFSDCKTSVMDGEKRFIHDSFQRFLVNVCPSARSSSLTCPEVPKEGPKIVTKLDSHTAELAFGTVEALRSSCGIIPYVVCARFHRGFIDANRSIEGGAIGYGRDETSSAFVKAAWTHDHYHRQIARCVLDMHARFSFEKSESRMFLLDIHGQAARDPSRNEQDVNPTVEIPNAKASSRTIYIGTCNGKTVTSHSFVYKKLLTPLHRFALQNGFLGVWPPPFKDTNSLKTQAISDMKNNNSACCLHGCVTCSLGCGAMWGSRNSVDNALNIATAPPEQQYETKQRREYSGGYTVQTYCYERSGLQAVQLEFGTSLRGVRATDSSVRMKASQALAQAIESAIHKTSQP